MAKSDWHYPRTEFAEKVYKYLMYSPMYGPVRGLKIFGPRQVGKTEFLMKDLVPLAEERGLRVVYADLWRSGDDCFVNLHQSPNQAVSGKPYDERLKTRTRSVAPMVRINVPRCSTEMKDDAADLNGEIPDGLWTLMDECCNQLAADDERAAFLLLDGFQEIAKATFNGDLIADTGSNLSRYHDGKVAVFSVASQDELRRILSDRSASLFAFTAELKLPPLAEDFVDHQLDRYKRIPRLSVERSDALEAFRRFNGNPMLFQHWLMHRSVNPDLTKDEAALNVLEIIAESLGFRSTWMDISQMDRAAARLLADGLSIYGEDGTRNIYGLTGREGITEEELKLAAERLYALRIAERNNGDWVIGNNLFENWIKEKPKYEFGW